MAPFDPHLLDSLEASRVDRVAGTVWRQILLPTSVLQPNQRGGRWNSLGTETLYSSLHPDTATVEIDHLLSAQPVPITRQRVTFPLDIAISNVIDLRPAPWGAVFTYAYDHYDVGQCQIIGSAAAWLGSGGLIVPSLRARGDNLAIFVANLDPDDVVEPRDPGFRHPPGPPATASWTPLAPTTGA